MNHPDPSATSVRRFRHRRPDGFPGEWDHIEHDGQKTWLVKKDGGRLNSERTNDFFSLDQCLEYVRIGFWVEIIPDKPVIQEEAELTNNPPDIGTKFLLDEVEYQRDEEPSPEEKSATSLIDIVFKHGGAFHVCIKRNDIIIVDQSGRAIFPSGKKDLAEWWEARTKGYVTDRTLYLSDAIFEGHPMAFGEKAEVLIFKAYGLDSNGKQISENTQTQQDTKVSD